MLEGKVKEVKVMALEAAKAQILNDLNSNEFNWDEFFELLVSENSPLLNIFSFKAMNLALLYNSISKSVEISSQIEG